MIEEATHKKFLSVRQEVNRQVKRNLDYYNLDMIISVDYRVKSLVVTRFRIWSMHIKNILEEGELSPEETIQEYLIAASEGKS